MNNKILAALGASGLAFTLFLAFGVFGIHTKFTNKEVSEGGPNFNSGAQVEESPGTESSESSITPPDDDTANSSDTPPPNDAANSNDTPPPSNADSETDQPMVTTEKVGQFSSLGSYTVAGDVSVLTDGNQRFLSLAEDFSSSNGPDLKVYLRSDSGDFVNLGKLKGNIGDQNYEIGTEVDINTYSKVEIWCERFSVGFGEARLADA